VEEDKMLEGLSVPVNDLLQYLGVLVIIETIILLMINFLAGDMVWVWVEAWWKKKPINVEWTKSKHWKFQVPVIPNGVPEIWELDKGTRVIEVRREAVGIAPHKIPMMLTTSEFPAAINPSEIHGERIFVPSEYYYGVLFNGEVHKVEEPKPEDVKEFEHLERMSMRTNEQDLRYLELNSKIEQWKNKKMWVKYPEHGLNVSEFVSFQRVSTDPKIVSAYARRKELDAKIASYSPMNTILQNPVPIVVILFGAAIAFWFLSDHSAALGAQQALSTCQVDLASHGITPASQATVTTIDPNVLARGGGVT
jgi:hypothetical protein